MRTDLGLPLLPDPVLTPESMAAAAAADGAAAAGGAANPAAAATQPAANAQDVRGQDAAALRDLERGVGSPLLRQLLRQV